MMKDALAFILVFELVFTMSMPLMMGMAEAV